MGFSKFFRTKAGVSDAGVEPVPASDASGADMDPGASSAPGADQTLAKASTRSSASILSGLLGRRKGQASTASSSATDTDAVQVTGEIGERPPVIDTIEPGVLKINGKEFAASLTWVSVLDGVRLSGHMETALSLAMSRKVSVSEMNLVCGSGETGGFYGFGSSDLGHRRGLPVLIESFNANAMGPNWIVVLKVDQSRDLWWVGARRNGNVFEDQITRSRDAAVAILMEALDAPGWTRIVAPEDWRIPRSVPHLPADWLDPAGLRLRHVNPLKVYGPRLLIVSLFLAGVSSVGFYFYEQQRRHAEEMAELRRQIQRAITLGPSDYPWFHRTPIDRFIALCVEEIDRSVVTIPGWENEIFTCAVSRGQGSVSTGWRLAGGNVAWLRASIPDDFPQISISAEANSASMTRTFTAPIDPDAMRLEPWTRQLIESRMVERFQLFDVNLNMRFVADNRPAETNPLFNRHDIQIEGDSHPSEIIPLIRDIPALIPESLTVNMATSTWSLIVRVHHPVILPEVHP